MKKVLIIVNHDIVIYNFRKELVEKLISEGYEVYIVSPMGERIPLLIEMGAYHIDIEMERRGTNPFKDLKLLRNYKRIIKDVKPDVVLTYTIKPNIYGGLAAKSLKVPYIANITGLGTAVENKGLLQKITLGLYKKAFKKINTVFFQNQENMDFFISKKISNVNNYKLLPGSGVNLTKFSLVDYSKSDKTKFVFISRIMKEKGIDLYLDAAIYFKNLRDDLEFHICGFCEEEYEGKLNELHKSGIIIYHGMVSDIRTVIKDMHCTIHPTYYPEGMSNVLLESAAMGKPLIASKRSGTREIIEHEQSGYLFESKNTEEMIEQIHKFLNLSFEEKKQMGINGRIKVEKEFDRQIVIDEYLNQIRKIEVLK